MTPLDETLLPVRCTDSDIEDKTGDIEDRLLNDIDILSVLVAGAVGGVGNAGFIGVFQELWEDARFSARLSIARHLP